MRLLIIGGLDGHFAEAARIAMRQGASVVQAEKTAAALDLLRNGKGADLALVDVAQPIGEFVSSLSAERIVLPVVACGLGNDAKAAVRAIQAGAKEYIPLPPDAELIAAVLAAVSEDSRALIAEDKAMQASLKLADQVAPADASVLITGESGTGKEVMARYLHRKSRRAEKPFVSLNCAAIPENLLESELFGHEKGAFTGAVARRVGKFEEADGGTLLLDEISEMDLRLQAKLLRVIQEREIDRVGGSRPVKVNIRLLATSNRNLPAEVKAGRFREDLYFRLNVVTIRLPSLRERPSDILPLARHFAKKYAEANGLPERPLTSGAERRLAAHAWPGNVRELENALHRAVLLAAGPQIDEGAILLGDPMSEAEAAPAAAMQAAVPETPPGSHASPTAGLVGRTVEDVERALILDTLSHTFGNRTHAATILGISIRTLRNKLRAYSDLGIPVPPPPGGEVEDREMRAEG